MNPEKNSWCNDWFNSPWYHKLYNKRDSSEAEHFIQQLLSNLKLPADAHVLDLACGKGRHSLALAKNNLDVIGIDLSTESIKEAKQFERDNLKFFVHDMRTVFRENYFDAVFNLFTSFGYSLVEADDVATINAVKAELKQGGIFVLDFFNAEKVKRAVAQDPEGKLDEENCHISWIKKIKKNRVEKDIVVNENGKIHRFHELVSLYTKNDFLKFFGNDLEVRSIFGDYSLNEFDEDNSDRLIIVAKKK